MRWDGTKVEPADGSFLPSIRTSKNESVKSEISRRKKLLKIGSKNCTKTKEELKINPNHTARTTGLLFLCVAEQQATVTPYPEPHL